MPPSDIWVMGLLGSLIVFGLQLFVLAPITGWMIAKKLGGSKSTGIVGACLGVFVSQVLTNFLPLDWVQPTSFWGVALSLVSLMLWLSTSGFVGAQLAIRVQRRGRESKVAVTE